MTVLPRTVMARLYVAMLQYITVSSLSTPVADQAQQAISCGCQWIHTQPQIQSLDQIVKLCQDAGVILTVEQDEEALTRYRLHGIALSDPSPKAIIEMRQRLGAHPIIGARISPDFEVTQLNGADIDYLLFPANKYDDLNILPGKLRDKGVEFHLVVQGSFKPDEVDQLLDAGWSGVALEGEGAADVIRTITGGIHV